MKPDIVTPVFKIPSRKGTNVHTRFANKTEHCFNLSQLKVTPNSKTDQEEVNLGLNQEIKRQRHPFTHGSIGTISRFLPHCLSHRVKQKLTAGQNEALFTSSRAGGETCSPLGLNSSNSSEGVQECDHSDNCVWKEVRIARKINKRK